MAEKGAVCVTGAAGFIGSWLIMRLLERGYTVRATVRDPKNMKKVKHLLDLPNASTKLTLWKADLVDEGSFDEPINGCVGVFHVATPMDIMTTDPENEVIKPAINGVLNILKSCVKAGTVRRVVYTSTAGTVSMQPQPKLNFDEDDWSDVGFLRTVQMPGWMYFVSKTLAEKTAFEFSEENNLDCVSIIPPLVNGPFITSTLPASMDTSLALITSNTPNYAILNPCVFVHVDDLCMAHIHVFEHPEAKGRYLCASHELTLRDLSNNLKEWYPEYDVVTEFQGVEVAPFLVKFSTKKLTDLGFEFKHSLKDMYDGAIQSCKEKGISIVPNKD